MTQCSIDKLTDQSIWNNRPAQNKPSFASLQHQCPDDIIINISHTLVINHISRCCYRMHNSPDTPIKRRKSTSSALGSTACGFWYCLGTNSALAALSVENENFGGSSILSSCSQSWSADASFWKRGHRRIKKQHNLEPRLHSINSIGRQKQGNCTKKCKDNSRYNEVQYLGCLKIHL